MSPLIYEIILIKKIYQLTSNNLSFAKIIFSINFKNVFCLDESWLEIQFDDAQHEFCVNIL